jgi:hypothetical protein
MKEILKVVHIKWEDSCSLHGWKFHRTVDEFAEESPTSQLMMHSVGFLLTNDKNGITLYQNISPDCKGNVIKIPRSAVRSMKVLGKVERG